MATVQGSYKEPQFGRVMTFSPGWEEITSPGRGVGRREVAVGLKVQQCC